MKLQENVNAMGMRLTQLNAQLGQLGPKKDQLSNIIVQGTQAKTQAAADAKSASEQLVARQLEFAPLEADYTSTKSQLEAVCVCACFFCPEYCCVFRFTLVISTHET